MPILILNLCSMYGTYVPTYLYNKYLYAPKIGKVSQTPYCNIVPYYKVARLPVPSLRGGKFVPHVRSLHQLGHCNHLYKTILNWHFGKRHT